MAWRTSLALAVLGVVVSLASADSVTVTTYTAPDGTNYLLTVGEGGACSPVTGGMECSGTMGRSSASVTGCGTVEGAAFCLIAPPGWTWTEGMTVNTTSTLRCGEVNYELSTGTSTGTCTRDKAGAMKCTDNGANAASATCESGCGAVSGAGSCTIPRREVKS